VAEILGKIAIEVLAGVLVALVTKIICRVLRPAA
jgi:hypothetical protein